MSRSLHEPAWRRRPGIAVWLFVCCGMVFGMIVLGALTRLTHSGLSMVHWRPVTGVLPPLSETEWTVAFEAYKQYPEYAKVNPTMDLAGFQGIFWLEYIHRLWGRLIGFVFALPLAWLLVRRRIDGRLAAKLLIMLVLGGLQGLLGWYMVQSGLVDVPDVSPYRLSAHLGAAFVVLGYMIWVALGLLDPRDRVASVSPPNSRLLRLAFVLLGLISVTVLSGGLVAGTNAGFTFNDFPWMGGRWIPAGLFALTPWFRNFFENVITVQFQHRLLGLSVLGLTTALWFWGWRRGSSGPRVRLPLHVLLCAGWAQVALGVATLWLHVPVSIAALHQAVSVVLFGLCLWVMHCVLADSADRHAVAEGSGGSPGSSAAGDTEMRERRRPAAASHRAASGA